ncbi:anti-sigma factor family protein [Sneathiella glossodoripedis]|uniref:anti-sigma factor family protein n=1 Tax=Sneathiella glossodoripedis TaxID=418853 RepID=UPI0004719F18|nr:hypothetical protein [Sneathiella glossodoripedis]
MAISESDWEQLNAYADGELSDTSSAELERRLSENADLRRELDKILALKRALQNLQPQPEHTEPRSSSHVIPWYKHAIAASIIVAIGIGAWGWQYYSERKYLNPELIHTQFAAQTYILKSETPRLHVSSTSIGEFHVPDLRATNLQLADTSFRQIGDRGVFSAHYRGQRGCRLTLIGTQNGVTNDNSSIEYDLENPERLLVAKWFRGQTEFALLASAMDKDRFKSIARYIHADLQREQIDKDDKLQIAMRDAYEQAHPCV